MGRVGGYSGGTGSGLDEAAVQALIDDSIADLPTAGEVTAAIGVAVAGLLDEAAHDALDHAGLTGIRGPVVACRVRRNAALDVTAVEAAIAWDTEIRDDGGCWSAAAATQLIAPADRWYLVGASAYHDNSNNDYLLMRLRQDGTTVLQMAEEINAVNPTPKKVVCSTAVYLTAGQYVEALIQSQATQALQVGAGHTVGWMVGV